MRFVIFLSCLIWLKCCLLQVLLDPTFGLNHASLHWTLTFKQLYKFVVSSLIFLIWSVTAAAPFTVFAIRACLFESPWPYLWSSHHFYILSLPLFCGLILDLYFFWHMAVLFFQTNIWLFVFREDAHITKSAAYLVTNLCNR